MATSRPVSRALVIQGGWPPDERASPRPMPELLDLERGSQRSWLYTVAGSIVIDEWRTTRRRAD